MTAETRAKYRLGCDGCSREWNSEFPLPSGFKHWHADPMDDFLEVEAARGRALARKRKEKFVETGEALLVRELTYEDLWPNVRSLKRRGDVPDDLRRAEKDFPQLMAAKKILAPVEYRKLVGDIRTRWKKQVRVPAASDPYKQRAAARRSRRGHKVPVGVVGAAGTGKLCFAGEDAADG